MSKTLIAFIVVFAIVAFAKTADATSYVTSAQVLDETLNSEDLGPDVTKVKKVSVSVAPSDDSCDPTDDTCTDPPGAGMRKLVVRCASGNVTGGGVRPDNPDDGYNLDIYGSFPSSDSSWTFWLWNSGPDTIDAQLRVVCI